MCIQWAKEKNSLRNYSRRRPEQSTLYRIVYHHREELEYKWDELFMCDYGVLREVVLKSLDEYLNCGILSSGCARAHCNSCNHSKLIAYSCKTRCLCSSCDSKRGVIFAEHVVENILYTDTPHSHIVFTIPKRLRVYFKYNRKLLKYLFTSAWEALKEICLSGTVEGSVCGAIMTLHTAGKYLNYHPHIHVLFLNAVVGLEGIVEKQLSMLSVELEKLFSNKLFIYLERAGVLESEIIRAIKQWPHSGFNIWIGESKTVDNDKEDMLYLARYLKKSTIQLENIEVDESSQKVLYKSPLSDIDEIKEFSYLEFLALLSQHIPNKWEQTTRYYGVYSARSRGKNKKKELVLDNSLKDDSDSQDEDIKVNSLWAICIKKVFEIDPLICPKCGIDMKIVSFFQSLKEIKKICNNLGETIWRAPPTFQQQATFH